MAARHGPMAQGLCRRLQVTALPCRLPLVSLSFAARAHPARTVGHRPASGRVRLPGHGARRSNPSPETGLFDADNLNLDDVPRDFFHKICSKDCEFFQARSADEYYECARSISDAIRQGAYPWTVPMDQNVPADTLYHLGCMMRAKNDFRGMVWVFYLWASASELGHDPSTISLVRNLVDDNLYMSITKMGNAEARFRQLVVRGTDPNALAVEGRWLFLQGRFEAAMAMLQRALEVGLPDFEWKQICRYWLGEAFMKVGRVQEAHEILESLADLGSLKAQVAVAKLLRTKDPARARQYMYAAGCRGAGDMFTFLSEMDLDEALTMQASDKSSSEEKRRWALEWSRLANQRSSH